MMLQRLSAVVLASLSYSYSWVLLSGRVLAGSGDSSWRVGCADRYISDGFCDLQNNNEACGYDGGDCCECTCVGTENYNCGHEPFGRFECFDPKAWCSSDVDDFSGGHAFLRGVISNEDKDHDDLAASYDYSPSPCIDTFIGDGDCDSDNNIDECGYDGGDCCECDCTSNSISICGFYNAYDCIDPTSPCVNGYVEAGTKTTVGVSANAYDSRPGQDSNMVGCQADGCAPALSRDGISADIESRWSCAQTIVPDGRPCEIEFTFEAPQDIMEIQVAFWKGDERMRTLEAAINGEVVGSFESYPGSTFNALGIQGRDVRTMTLTSIGIDEDEWTSLLEVRFLVKP